MTHDPVAHLLPSIGRVVHYTNLGDKDGKYPPEIQAAIVTGVYAGEDSANQVGQKASSHFVDLKVFYRTGLFDTKKVPYSPEPARGHWNWPPRA